MSMKRLLAMLLAIVMVVGMMPNTVFASETVHVEVPSGSEKPEATEPSEPIPVDPTQPSTPPVYGNNYPVLKVDEPVDKAFRQIREKGYADPYAADTRPVWLIGLSFDSKTRRLAGCAAEPFNVAAQAPQY